MHEHWALSYYTSGEYAASEVTVATAFGLPFPQVLEQWLTTGLQTYTGVCLALGSKPDLKLGRSWSTERMFRH